VIAARWFYFAAATFTAGGTALRLAPASAPEVTGTASVAAGTPGVPPRPSFADSQRYAAVVAANAFSASRTAPETRFIPEGLRKEAPPVVREPRKPREVPVLLFGISRGPGGAVALIDADPAVPGAEVYRLGETVRDGRLTALGDTTVVLTRPSGRVVLRLPDAGEQR
jgi:hypothetical protein